MTGNLEQSVKHFCLASEYSGNAARKTRFLKKLHFYINFFGKLEVPFTFDPQNVSAEKTISEIVRII